MGRKDILSTCVVLRTQRRRDWYEIHVESRPSFTQNATTDLCIVKRAKIACLSRPEASRTIEPMKRILAFLLSIILIGIANSASAAGKIHHVVCFKFKSTATTDQIKQVEEAFAALQEKIPGIESLKWGTNVSQEQRNKGFTHCFVLTFKTQKDRDTYLDHPEHKAFAKLVGPVVDDVFVIDFVPQKK
jgi:hypothetical protein